MRFNICLPSIVFGFLYAYVGLSTSFGQIIPSLSLRRCRGRYAGVPSTYVYYVSGKASRIGSRHRAPHLHTGIHTIHKINCATVFIYAALWCCISMWPKAINALVQAECKSIQNKYSSLWLSVTQQSQSISFATENWQQGNKFLVWATAR